MDKKKIVKTLPEEDLRGFEEFIDGSADDSNFLPKGIGGKKDVSFEHFTFLTNDSERLFKIKSLLSEKMPFMTKYSQAKELIREQLEENDVLREKIFEISDKPQSNYRKSLADVFDGFFNPPKF